MEQDYFFFAVFFAVFFAAAFFFAAIIYSPPFIPHLPIGKSDQRQAHAGHSEL
jgi:hypothetical protein